MLLDAAATNYGKCPAHARSVKFKAPEPGAEDGQLGFVKHGLGMEPDHLYGKRTALA